MPRFVIALGVFAAFLAACGGGGGTSPSVPTPVPATPSPAPTPTPPPTSGPLGVSYTTSYQSAQATPYPATVPIQLFAQTQSALLIVSGGTAPYAGQLLYCTSGQGFGAPFTFAQNPDAVSFRLTATQYAGSCTVYIADSSSPFKSIQLQATLTTTSGTAQ